MAHSSESQFSRGLTHQLSAFPAYHIWIIIPPITELFSVFGPDTPALCDELEFARPVIAEHDFSGYEEAVQANGFALIDLESTSVMEKIHLLFADVVFGFANGRHF